MDKHIVSILLLESSSIIQRFNSIQKLSGENYNIFRLLKMDTNEVKLHSAFLGDLLDPSSNHGFKSVFLNHFLDHFEIKNFETADALVQVEKYIGPVTEESGGRIDILISDKKGRNIIIENKINAGDQKNQLLRYHSYDCNAHIIYLTLDGNAPSEYSMGGLRTTVYNKSYRNNIIDWLENCVKETYHYPILRETITQYINLIKYLTGQSTNNKMEAELTELISSNPRYVEAFYTIKKIENEIKSKLLKDLKEDVKYIGIEIETKYKNLSVEFLAEGIDIELGLYIKSKDWSNFMIGFEFEKNWDDAYYGICSSEKDIPIDQITINKLQSRLPKMDYCTNQSWPFATSFENWFNRQYDKIIPEIARKEIQIKIKVALEELISKVLGNPL